MIRKRTYGFSNSKTSKLRIENKRRLEVLEYFEFEKSKLPLLIILKHDILVSLYAIGEKNGCQWDDLARTKSN